MVRRWLVVLLLIGVLQVERVSAQTDTPTPTPTSTPTATPTPSMTPELALYVTVIPPGGTIEDMQAGAIVFEVSAGEVIIALLLFGYLLIQVFHAIIRARGHDA